MTNLFKDKKETSINYLPEQIKDIQDTNKFKRDVTMPAYKDYTDGWLRWTSWTDPG